VPRLDVPRVDNALRNWRVGEFRVAAQQIDQECFVEIGQLLALAGILIAISFWRRSPSFRRHAYAANTAMMTAGFILVGMHLAGYFATQAL
jgi:hypothetical protein